MYSDLMDFIDRIFTLLGINGISECRDILSFDNAEPVDIVFFQKISPCIELLEPGSTSLLFEKIKAKYILATFPTKSIGGKNKGMVDNYSTFFYELIKIHGWDYEIFSFSNELAFLIDKHDKD
jgi:16S rRNA (guanine(1405)-N(7))-methyltransferase